MKGSMFRKGLIAGIILLFIGVGIQPVFPNNITINNENQILDPKENNKTIQSDEARFYCFGRIDDLNINETHCSFDCINFRMYFRFYFEGLLYSGKIHHKKNNTFERIREGDSLKIQFIHYYNKDFVRLYFSNYKFSGIIKPSYIFGCFSISLNNSTNLKNYEFLENNNHEYINENLILHNSYVIRHFFKGNISNLEIEDDYYYFDSTNYFRIYYTKFVTRWMFGIERIRDQKHGFGFSGAKFIGTLTPEYICGFFIYP